jgi:hypothetical protein
MGGAIASLNNPIGYGFLNFGINMIMKGDRRTVIFTHSKGNRILSIAAEVGAISGHWLGDRVDWLSDDGTIHCWDYS